MPLRQLEQIEGFLNYIFAELERLEIDISLYELDHVCYRTSTAEEYEAAKIKAASLGTIISEALINGRPITCVELHQPFTFRGRSISLLEIPAPKIGSITVSGFEHVEFVIGEEFEDFLAKNKRIRFELSGLTKSNNQEIVLKLAKASVKFHRISLKEIIAEESR